MRVRTGVRLLAALVLALTAMTVSLSSNAHADSYQRISGEGSSWAFNAIDAMRVNVKQFGITVDYNPSGSSAGRKDFLNGTVDFAASDIPFQFHPEDGSPPENPQPGSYAYIPVVAGGTSFMYNLKINGQQVTNLRLSGLNVAKIFTGAVTKWNDPAIQADNPGLTMPDRTIVPVVRSDGSGSSDQFTRWMIHTHNDIWMAFCNRSGRAPKCGDTSYYPTVPGMIAQSRDEGIAGYVSQSFAEGAIGYVNYSYALNTQFPVAKVLNAAGYYTEPTPQNVAVSLLKARINFDQNSQDYLTQILDDVYTDTDDRNYQLSSYSYFILPTKVQGQFNTDKGKTLGAFTYYAMCQAQQQSASLGYSPLPVNLVKASLDQIKKIPGVVVENVDISKCNNPTFSPDGTNVLALNAPHPPPCDKQGPTQCATGTGGLAKKSTPVKPGASGGGPSRAAGPGGRGAAGAGAGAASGSTGAAGAAGSTGAAACDPTLGSCDAGANGGGGSDNSGDLAVGGQAATVLPGAKGWGSSQTLMVFITLLVLALLILPPAVWQRLSGTKQ